jgi:hypothetical protein
MTNEQTMAEAIALLRALVAYSHEPLPKDLLERAATFLERFPYEPGAGQMMTIQGGPPAEDGSAYLQTQREQRAETMSVAQFVAFGQRKYGSKFVDALHEALEKSGAQNRRANADQG